MLMSRSIAMKFVFRRANKTKNVNLLGRLGPLGPVDSVYCENSCLSAHISSVGENLERLGLGHTRQ